MSKIIEIPDAFVAVDTFTGEPVADDGSAVVQSHARALDIANAYQRTEKRAAHVVPSTLRLVGTPAQKQTFEDLFLPPEGDAA